MGVAGMLMGVAKMSRKGTSVFMPSQRELSNISIKAILSHLQTRYGNISWLAVRNTTQLIGLPEVTLVCLMETVE